MPIARSCPGKVNLVLNVLGRRPDGFHELETVLLPVPVADELTVDRGGSGIQLTCSLAALPTDSRNLVHRAAAAFLDRAGLREGVVVHLEKQLPLESGLGGGSSNAANALLALNEIFDQALPQEALGDLAAGLGSDVPFFLHSGPALATGRGETIEPLPAFEVLRGCWIFLVHPGFGVPTPWAYKQLASYPEALNGRPGRARELVNCLQDGDLSAAGAALYNALEGPVHTKYPILMLYQDYLKGRNPLGVLMSGSGSTTFSIWASEAEARAAEAGFREEFGAGCWTAVAPL